MRPENVGKLFILLITLQTLATVLIAVCITLLFVHSPQSTVHSRNSLLSTVDCRPLTKYQEGESLKPEDKVISY